MSDPDDWGVDDFVRESLPIIADIQGDPSVSLETARVVFHFQPRSGGQEEEWGEEASYVPAARAAFDRLSLDLDVEYVGGWSGIEAFEKVVPTEAWLRDRIPQMVGVAQDAGIQFYAWSFEPKEGRFRTVSPTLNVLVGGSPEANELIDNLSRRADDASRTLN